MSLSIRIFIWLWVALLAVAGLMLAWPKVLPAGPQALDANLTKYSADQVERIERMLERSDKKRKRWLKHGRLLPDGSLLWLYDNNLHRFTSDRVPPEVAERIMTMLDLEEPIIDFVDHRWMLGPLAIDSGNYQLTAFIGLSEKIGRGAWLRHMVRQSPLLLVCVALLLGGLAYLVARQIVKPLVSLRRTAKQIAGGEFAAAVPQQVLLRKDEIGSLGRTVSSMGHTIDSALDAHKRLLSDVSHELRSPLTRLSLANTLAEKRAGESEESARIRHEAEVLNEMIEQLLSLSRMQLMPQHDRQPVAIISILNQCFDNLRFSHPELQLQLNNQLASDNILVSGNEDLFKRAISNVLDNASRYADAVILVSIDESDGQLELVLEDDGCGVPEQELDKLFEPFYRPEFARDRSRGGAGLGLAIVAQAVKFHGGQVAASLADSGGLRIVITMPLVDESA
ncbi:HAMP domain-containing protein [Neiella marina]|uniref:histidine kinase n=1 Tax=Neiella holothuriorum TaxID=2870530 RepID=A0ABS7EIT9_9GAMM|nr:ATP-binding protein [Neiella holothuriorum]MBW8192272.1 HAMP domain-containing protein [Neiella holothuriorum]